MSVSINTSSDFNFYHPDFSLSLSLLGWQEILHQIWGGRRVWWELGSRCLLAKLNTELVRLQLEFQFELSDQLSDQAPIGTSTLELLWEEVPFCCCCNHSFKFNCISDQKHLKFRQREVFIIFLLSLPPNQWNLWFLKIVAHWNLQTWNVVFLIRGKWQYLAVSRKTRATDIYFPYLLHFPGLI